MKKKKRLLPILASLALVSGPVLVLTACSPERDMNNLPNGSINDKDKNRILFSFLGVNYSKTVSEQFKDTYQQGLEFILKDVQGIIAKQNFYDFFHNVLHYSADSDDKTEGQANAAFEALRDQIGLSLLTKQYLSGLNTANSLDKISVEDKNELLFQNQSWHQDGTSTFEYKNVPFYTETDAKTTFSNNPDSLFSPTALYKDYDNQSEVKTTNADFDAQLIKVAKHADANYSDEISKLLPANAKKWNGNAGLDQKPKFLDDTTDTTAYKRNLKRFQLWLRFRYQQYYKYEILPDLNKTLFTMSYILNNLFEIKDNSAGKPVIQTPINNIYISQLQDTITWGKSNYNLSWNFNTSLSDAQNIDEKWNGSPSQPPAWASIVSPVSQTDKKQTLNTAFLKQMKTGNSASLNIIDPNFGVNGYNSADTNKQQTADWVTNGGLHYTTNNKIATFTYNAPIYFLNLIQNLDFSYLKNDGTPQKWIPETNNLIQKWVNSGNKSLNSAFSQYIRGGDDSNISQDQKWNIFWQMLYSIANINGDDSPGNTNFNNAAKTLFPKFIPKENIYEAGFWKLVQSFYP